MNKTYYIPKKAKVKTGIVLILFSLTPHIFFYLVTKSTSFFDVFILFGWFNIVWLIFFQSGVSFLIIKKLPILIFNKSNFLYNDFFMPRNRGDGLFFILTPYTYRNLTAKIDYSEIQDFKLRDNFMGKSLSITLKTKKNLLEYHPTLNLNSFSEKEITEITDFLNKRMKKNPFFK